MAIKERHTRLQTISQVIDAPVECHSGPEYALEY